MHAFWSLLIVPHAGADCVQGIQFPTRSLNAYAVGILASLYPKRHREAKGINRPSKSCEAEPSCYVVRPSFKPSQVSCQIHILALVLSVLINYRRQDRPLTLTPTLNEANSHQRCG
jgi:hypothetical protein